LLSLNLKQDVTVGVSLTIITYIIVCIHLSHICLAHIVYMLGEVIDESQENAEILRRQEAHGSFCFPHKGITDETRTLKQRTSNYFSWSPS